MFRNDDELRKLWAHYLETKSGLFDVLRLRDDGLLLCAESDEFYRAKLQTAEFYFDRMMPRANSHRSGALSSTRSVMQMDREHFAFS